MDEITFVHLDEIPEAQLIELMNHPQVAKYMPLLSGGFGPQECAAFRNAKQAFWDEHGYGPWGILIHGEFAGWGGIQPENGEADFGLVLHPRFWGWGRKVFNRIVSQAFGAMALPSITILLPPSRPNSGAIARLGFLDDGEYTIEGQVFRRFRLNNPNLSATS